MKAYRHEDGSIWTFRPEENAARMVRSVAAAGAARCCPSRTSSQAVDALVEADQRWVPEAGGGEEPLPPAVHVRLRGVPRRAARPARHLHGDRLARPAPTSRAASSRSRSGSPRTTPAPAAAAWARPRPAATTPARWSPSRRPPRRAATRSSSSTRQEGRYVEELGGMNLYFVYDDGHIVTPELRHDPRGHHPLSDHRAAPASWATRSRSAGSPSTSGATASASGGITEVFACGTAAVVTPVGTLKWDGGAGRRRPTRDRPGDDGRSARRSSTSSTAAPRTPSAGCTASSDARRGRGDRPRLPARLTGRYREGVSVRAVRRAHRGRLHACSRRIGEGGMGVVHLAAGAGRHPGRAEGAAPAHRRRRRGPRPAGPRGRARCERISSRWIAEIVDADPWGDDAVRRHPLRARALACTTTCREEGPITGADLAWFAALPGRGASPAVHAGRRAAPRRQAVQRADRGPRPDPDRLRPGPASPTTRGSPTPAGCSARRATSPRRSCTATTRPPPPTCTPGRRPWPSPATGRPPFGTRPVDGDHGPGPPRRARPRRPARRPARARRGRARPRPRAPAGARRDPRPAGRGRRRPRSRPAAPGRRGPRSRCRCRWRPRPTARRPRPSRRTASAGRRPPATADGPGRLLDRAARRPPAEPERRRATTSRPSRRDLPPRRARPVRPPCCGAAALVAALALVVGAAVAAWPCLAVAARARRLLAAAHVLA